MTQTHLGSCLCQQTKFEIAGDFEKFPQIEIKTSCHNTDHFKQ